ncbi:MAG: hypothetical protein MUE35_01690 [Hydrogenophaga sp.]|nr:hypothetical protein [Hydrogenophaga sp.]
MPLLPAAELADASSAAPPPPPQAATKRVDETASEVVAAFLTRDALIFCMTNSQK